MGDSSREFSVIAEVHEQPHTPELQDYELARLQQCAQAPGGVDDLVRSRNVLGRHGKRGRQPTYSDAAVRTCLTMKVLFGMALGQTTGFVESLLGLVGLDWKVPDFSTLPPISG